jgi:hypothetical protein
MMEHEHQNPPLDDCETDEFVQDQDDEIISSSARRPLCRRKLCCWMAALLVVLIVAIVVPTVTKKHSPSQSKTANGPVAFVPELSTDQVQHNKNEFGNALLKYYTTYKFNWNDILDATSPQGIALAFVCGSKNYAVLDPAQRVQRYALAVLYYSTFSKAHAYYHANNGTTTPGWTSAVNWITSSSECDWEGILCSDGISVVGILLREHSLTGSLPLELAFLQSLTHVDLTTNFVFVDGDNASSSPISHLGQLQELLLEDNFVVTTKGMPVGMSALTQLQKVTMSYNLLQGPLNGTMLGRMAQLTHLEVESNFLTGGLPVELMSNQNLVYLYLRRNLLQIHLPTLLANGNIPSIFALWLDSNNVTGSIPASIGSNHSFLASLSITNTSLSGSIPTQIANLTSLQRVWLFQNQLTGPIPAELAASPKLEVLELYQNSLTGTMPTQLCSRIAAATYTFKALTVDCNQVPCSCCTKCY